MPKTLNDFPEYQKAAEELRALEDEQRQIEQRKTEIENLANTAEPVQGVLMRQSWREEYQSLERREPALQEALQSARATLAAIRGQCSLKICEQARPLFVKQTRRILRALKELSEANDELGRIRSELTQKGVDTGSVPACNFQADAWNDPYGNKVVGYRRFVAEHFPELKTETE